MEYFGILGRIAGVFLLACLSPGPAWTWLGLTLTWATLALLGLGFLTQLARMTVAIKPAGAAYLIWIGCRMIAGAHRPAPVAGSMPNAWHGGRAALRRGYLSSIANPKAAAFFGSIFVVTLPTHLPGWVYATAIALLAVLSAGWHCGLAVVFSVAPIQTSLRRAKAKIDTLVGAVLIILGVRLAVSW